MEVNRNQNGLVTNILKISFMSKKKKVSFGITFTIIPQFCNYFHFGVNFPFRSAKNPQITVEVLIKLDKTFNKYLRSSFIK